MERRPTQGLTGTSDDNNRFFQPAVVAQRPAQGDIPALCASSSPPSDASSRARKPNSPPATPNARRRPAVPRPARHRRRRNQGKPRRRCRQAHARGIDRARQCHPARRRRGAARCARATSRQRRPWPDNWRNGAATTSRRLCSSSAAPMGFPQPRRQGGFAAVVRRRHLAAPARPGHVAGTALPRHHDPHRASLSSGLTTAARLGLIPDAMNPDQNVLVAATGERNLDPMICFGGLNLEFPLRADCGAGSGVAA